MHEQAVKCRGRAESAGSGAVLNDSCVCVCMSRVKGQPEGVDKSINMLCRYSCVVERLPRGGVAHRARVNHLATVKKLRHMLRVCSARLVHIDIDLFCTFLANFLPALSLTYFLGLV